MVCNYVFSLNFGIVKEAWVAL